MNFRDVLAGFRGDCRTNRRSRLFRVVLRDGARRVIAPADAAWDDFFASPGVDLGEGRQPERQEREAL